MTPRLKLLRLKLLGGAATLSLLDPLSAAAAPLPSWTGFYIGGHAGYSWGSTTGDLTENVLIPAQAPFVFTPTRTAFAGVGRDLNPRGALGGIQGGYNYQIERWVYGLEADLTWTGQDDSFVFSGRRNNLNTEDFIYEETLAAKLRVMGTVRGRFGYAFDAFLPYITGGFAWGRVDADLRWTATQQPTGINTPFARLAFSGSQSETLVGWTVGAGFEYAFAPRWSARVEYLFVELGEKTFFAGTPGGATFGVHDQIVRFAINFRP